MSPSRIVGLSQTIAYGTAVVVQHLVSNGLPTPSFDVETPLELDLPNAIKEQRQAVLEATEELNMLMRGPMGIVGWLRETTNPALQAIHRFKIAFSFPIDGTATFAEIAKNCGHAEAEIRRILRFAMTYRMFREVKPGVVAHTAATKALVERPLFHQWIGMWLEEMGITLSRMVDAMAKWPASQEPNEAAFNLAYNTDRELYEEISTDPTRAIRFKDAMEYFQTAPGFETRHVLSGFDWSTLPQNGTVVDVGGSHGVACAEIARHNPSLRFIVQDRQEVIKAAVVPDDVKDRIEFVAYDFFQEQPVKSADVYFYRWIYHNWSDKYCEKITRALMPALKAGARLLIQDILLPEPGELSALQEREARWTDLGMLAMANAKERDRNDWVELFKGIDPKFKVKNIVTPEKSQLSIVEVVWDEQSAQQAPPQQQNVNTGDKDIQAQHGGVNGQSETKDGPNLLGEDGLFRVNGEKALPIGPPRPINGQAASEPAKSASASTANGA